MRKSHEKVVSILQLPVLISAFAVFPHSIIAVTDNILIAEIAYSFFYASINWILLSLTKFVVYYAYNKVITENYKLFTILSKTGLVLMTLACVDSVVILLNTFSGAVFKCVQIKWNDGLNYFITEKLAYFGIHITYSYFLIVLILGVIISKVILTPPVYWFRYLCVLTSLLATVLWDGLFVLNKTSVDLSVIGYAIASVLLMYFTLVYNPNYLVNKILSRMADRNNDMLLFFDADRDCIYVNSSAIQMFGIKYGMNGVLDMSGFFDVLDDCGFDWKMPSFSCTCTKKFNGRNIHLEISYYSLYYQKRLEGSFFQVRDCTKEITAYNDTYYRLAHDSLTGLYNSDYLSQRIRHTLSRDRDGWYMIVTDVKNFKLINDLFGKTTGDMILKRQASVMKGGAKPGELFGRIGIDRFALMTKYPEDFKRDFFANNDKLGKILLDADFPVVIHAGIYKISNPDMSPSKMFDRAFMAVETIKNSYDVLFADYDDSLRQKMVWQNEIIGELDTALDEGQFELYLQPQADSQRVIRGAEALIRWNHPKKGLLPPSWFIKIFEENGLIIKLDLFMWDKACQTLRKWKDMGKEDYYISVNISPHDFYFIDVYKTFVDLVNKYNINPRNLKIEITESAMIVDLERRILLIDKLRYAGFHVEIDDFGSGYSSLNMLKDINVNVLKIDMFFLYKAKDIKRSRTIIKQIVALAKALDMTVVTEGIETVGQFEFLVSIGCDMYQGYYFSRPISLTDFENKYIWHTEESQNMENYSADEHF